jgi:hypothetical protein
MIRSIDEREMEIFIYLELVMGVGGREDDGIVWNPARHCLVGVAKDLNSVPTVTVAMVMLVDRSLKFPWQTLVS